MEHSEQEAPLALPVRATLQNAYDIASKVSGIIQRERIQMAEVCPINLEAVCGFSLISESCLKYQISWIPTRDWVVLVSPTGKHCFYEGQEYTLDSGSALNFNNVSFETTYTND